MFNQKEINKENELMFNPKTVLHPQIKAPSNAGSDGLSGVFWVGSNGHVYTKDNNGQVLDKGASSSRVSNGMYVDGVPNVQQQIYRQISDPNAGNTNNNNTNNTGGGSSAPKLDQSQIDSLLASLGIYDADRDNAKRQAAIKRDTFKREKDEELKKERDKYSSKKQTVAQEYGTARVDTDLNARNTLQNLLSSLSTLGMGGSRELTRQILAAANQSNRQANTTQAQNNQQLDSAFNEYKGGYDNDVRKINDQYGADVAGADKTWAEKRRDTLHRVGNVYGQADRTAERDNYMRQGDNLNSIISNSAFMSPSYTGESRAMATPELASYAQDVAQYDTTAIGGNQANGANVPGNLAMKAIAMNDKDFGIKKKNEADLGYGV